MIVVLCKQPCVQVLADGGHRGEQCMRRRSTPADASLGLPRVGLLCREDARHACATTHQHRQEPSGQPWQKSSRLFAVTLRFASGVPEICS